MMMIIPNIMINLDDNNNVHTNNESFDCNNIYTSEIISVLISKVSHIFKE